MFAFLLQDLYLKHVASTSRSRLKTCILQLQDPDHKCALSFSIAVHCRYSQVDSPEYPSQRLWSCSHSNRHTVCSVSLSFRKCVLPIWRAVEFQLWRHSSSYELSWDEVYKNCKANYFRRPWKTYMNQNWRGQTTVVRQIGILYTSSHSTQWNTNVGRRGVLRTRKIGFAGS